MSGIVRVHSIESLDELTIEIKRFIWQAQEMLKSIEQEINHTKVFLQDQINHWINEEERYRGEVLNASVAFEQCQDEDDQNCSIEEELLAQAKWHLRQSQIEFQETTKRIGALEKVEQDYMMQARRLKRMMDNDVQNGVIFLTSLATTLKKCVAKSI